jgi:methylphosphotriester-DNA--protein-cysteine methyltransferase
MNENFQLRLHNQKTYESFFSIAVRRHKIVLHCLLDEGSFIFNKLDNIKNARVLSIEVDKDIFDNHIKLVSNKIFAYAPCMTLQLLELLDAMQQENNTHEVEVMSFALCSTAMNISYAKKAAEPVNFQHAQLVYNTVQQWKRSAQRVKSFKKFTPPGMSDKHFVEIVQALYNCTTMELVNNINMQKAMTMLLGSQDAIAVISEQSGYTKKENFIIAFRNAFGVTPGHLKKQFR